MKGKPVTILTLDSDDNFILDTEALNLILGQRTVKDKPVCILPISGAFRKGKSFLLNFLLRYLDADGADGWISKEGSLEGFPWEGGSQGCTQGVILWSQPFILTKDGREVAVLIMDTQGAFDRETSMKATSLLFSIALLTSSTLIYNLDENIQEDDLQHLQFFTHYGRLAEEEGGKPFHRLMVLVRDWQFPYEKQFGLEGGQQLLEEVLEIKESQPEELRALRKDLRGCFQDITCFLLPYPGRAVTNPAFSGSTNEMDPEFVQQVEQLVPELMSGLAPKKDGGRILKCGDITHYFQSYVQALNSSLMPSAVSLLAASVEAGNLARAEAARELYEEGMQAVAGGDKPYVNPEVLDSSHRKWVESALRLYSEGPRLGGEQGGANQRDRLLEELEETYTQLKEHNEGKNIIAVAGTPLTLAFLYAVLFLASYVAPLLLLGPLLLPLIGWLQVATVFSGIAWGGSKYSGRVPWVGETLDSVTQGLRQRVVLPLLGKAVEKYAAQ